MSNDHWPPGWPTEDEVPSWLPGGDQRHIESTMPNQDWPPEDGDITHMIERLDALEEREGVRFESLYAMFFTDTAGCPMVRVCGEIHPREGLEIAHGLIVVASAYDPKGRVIHTGESWIPDTVSFYGFRAFTINLNPLGRITRIRMYPQRV